MAAEQQFVGEITADPAQQAGGNTKHGRAMQTMREFPGERDVPDRKRRGRVERAGHVPGDDMRRSAAPDRRADRRHPLQARAERTAETELNGVCSRERKPPSRPTTSPMRRAQTRTPCASASRAACSQASHRSWLKQPCDFADSSAADHPSPYQPIAEPLTSTRGLCASRAISGTMSPVMVKRDCRMSCRLAPVQRPLPIGSPARLTIASIAVSAAS